MLNNGMPFFLDVCGGVPVTIRIWKMTLYAVFFDGLVPQAGR